MPFRYRSSLIRAVNCMKVFTKPTTNKETKTSHLNRAGVKENYKRSGLVSELLGLILQRRMLEPTVDYVEEESYEQYLFVIPKRDVGKSE